MARSNNPRSIVILILFSFLPQIYTQYDPNTIKASTSKKLRILVPVRAGFPELIKVESHQFDVLKHENVTGYCIDVFKASIESLQYDVSYDFIPHFGSHTDLIDQVYFQNFDAAVGDITITSNRSRYVDFTMSFTDLGLGSITKKAKRNTWFFLEPLDAGLWLMVAGVFILVALFIWLIEHPINEKIKDLPTKEIGTAIWFSLSVLVFARSEKLESNLSRFLATGWVFVVLILTSSYTAILSSVLTVQQIQLASKDSIGYQGFDLARGAIVKELNFTSFQRYGSPEEYATVLSQGSKHGGVDVVIDEIPYLKIFMAKYSADYSFVSSESTTNSFGFVFQKGSTLVPDMSSAIAKLREEGMLQLLEKQWFMKSSLADQDSAGSDASKVKILDFHSFRGLFLTIGVSLALALLIFWVQSLYEKLLDVKNFIFTILAGGKLAIMMSYIFRRNATVIEEIDQRQPT